MTEKYPDFMKRMKARNNNLSVALTACVTAGDHAKLSDTMAKLTKDEAEVLEYWASLPDIERQKMARAAGFEEPPMLYLVP